jgi:glycosyltransferase involved in cell wall biosynthesis
MLSVVVPTYNHERYIAKALESILMQKVRFPYEVLIGADLSSDNTHGALRELEKTLPDNFQVFYRETSLKMHGNFQELYSRTRGKYVIMLEGDDYWTYEHKLQKQVDFLEAHPEYTAVAHNTLVVDGDDVPILNERYPECTDNEFTLEHFKRGLLPGHTATLLHRNYHTQNIFPADVEFVPYAPDSLRVFILAANGKILCIQEKWSVYRYVTSGSTSWTAEFHDDDDHKKRTVLYYGSLYRYSLGQVRTRQSVRASAQLYFYYRLRWSLGKKALFPLKDFWEEFSKAPCKGAIFAYTLYRMGARIALGKPVRQNTVKKIQPRIKGI